MSLLSEFQDGDPQEIGQKLHWFAEELFPICRSITGNGTRQTLAKIQQKIPLQLCEVPTGTPVLDWSVPKEWNIRDAFLKDASGRRVVDFQKNNLHVLNYSAPIHKVMPLSELKPHLFTIPAYPGAIPYRTAYYKEDWGLCLAHDELEKLKDGEYEICIDSSLKDGHLTYGELLIPGKSRQEILISCHVCHPSLANDNLSGITVATHLARLLSKQPRRYSYRFLFIPGTIGSITWLARNRDGVSRIRNGLVLSCIGDNGKFHYKKSRRGNAEIDRAAQSILKGMDTPGEVLDFVPYGYDERQFCSPGFDLAFGCLMRSVWGTFPEYHNSTDNLEFIKPEALAQSLGVCAGIMDLLERNRRYLNLFPFGEPQLGRRGLYGSKDGDSLPVEINARLWVLNFSDGKHSLLDIAERSELSFSLISDAAEVLLAKGLLSLEEDDAEANPPLDNRREEQLSRD
ncbi:MAG: DUF4910 domain-containing protein [Terriglobales bacterium]